MRKKHLLLLLACWLLAIPPRLHAIVETTIPISPQLGNSIAGDLFPVTLRLTEGNLHLTDPVLLYLDQGRIGMQVRIQAYDHRPEENIAISETGSASFSGRLSYDRENRQLLLFEPKIDRLVFDQRNDATRRFLSLIKVSWATRVTNPMRADLPPHPYLAPFRNNIRDIYYDGKTINLTMSFN